MQCIDGKKLIGKGPEQRKCKISLKSKGGPGASKRRVVEPTSRSESRSAGVNLKMAWNHKGVWTRRQFRIKRNHSSVERWAVASSSTQSSSSQTIPFRPGTRRVGPALYRGQDFGP